MHNIQFNSSHDKAYAEFDTMKIADEVFKLQIYAKNTKRAQIQITYAIDATKIKQMMWSAVVLRNLPHSITSEMILERCKDDNERVKYVLPIAQVKSTGLIRPILCSSSDGGFGRCRKSVL